MNKDLFKKYTTQIQKRDELKKEIISDTLKETGVILQENEFEVVKKQINLTTSSVKKQKLFQKNFIKILQTKGLTLKQ